MATDSRDTVFETRNKSYQPNEQRGTDFHAAASSDTHTSLPIARTHVVRLRITLSFLSFSPFYFCDCHPSGDVRINIFGHEKCADSLLTGVSGMWVFDPEDRVVQRRRDAFAESFRRHATARTHHAHPARVNENALLIPKTCYEFQKRATNSKKVLRIPKTRYEFQKRATNSKNALRALFVLGSS